MHKAPNAFNPSGTIRKKFLLCKSTKKARYVRSLGKKPHFGAFPEAKKVLLSAQSVCARLRKAAHWPNNNANPSGLSEKKVYCVESLQFCRLGGNFSFERGGLGPSKKCWFWCNGPSTKAPQIPLRHQKHSIWHYFYRIWRY